jgi:hypothetical protein
VVPGAHVCGPGRATRSGGEAQVQSVVDKKRGAAFEVIVIDGQVKTLKTKCFQVFLHCNLRRHGIGFAAKFDDGGRVKMVNERRNSRKALCANEFFVV